MRVCKLFCTDTHNRNDSEVSGKTLVQYVSCTYEKYLQEKEFRAKSAIAEYERNLKEAERLQVVFHPSLVLASFWTNPLFCVLQDFVDKFGASATKASQAQSRVKAIERMRKEGKLDPRESPRLCVCASSSALTRIIENMKRLWP